MEWSDVLGVATTILLALGGGGAIVVGLSGFLGKLWADRLMIRERADHDRELEQLRSELSATNARQIESLKTDLELAKTKLLGAHQDKVAMYRMVVDIVAEMLVYLGFAAGTQLSASDKLERVVRFERERMRAYGYLGMFAPQHVMDSFDRVIDYLTSVLEQSKAFDFAEARTLGIAMLNEIRIDLGIDRSPIVYRGSR